MARGNNEARFTANIQDFESKLTKMNTSLAKFAKGGTTSMSGLAGSFGKLAASFGLAASAAQTLRNNINTAMNFEKALSGLKSLTGAGAKDMQYFKEQAIQMGAATTQTATQVAEAMQLIGSSMPTLLQNTQGLSQVTRMTITLAEAANIGVADAAKALTNSLNQMGAGAEEAGRFINVLAAGSRNGAGNIQYLSDAIVKSGAMARIAGVSYEELVAMIEAVAKSGVDASTAGTELRNIMLKLESQNDSQLKPSVVGLTTALKNLAAQEMDSAEMKNFFGKRTLTVAANLIKEAENMDELIGKITDTDTAYEQAAVNTDNFKGSIDKLASAWEGLNLAINSSNGYLRGFIDRITETIGKLTDLMNGDALGTSAVNGLVGTKQGVNEAELRKMAAEMREQGKSAFEISTALRSYAQEQAKAAEAEAKRLNSKTFVGPDGQRNIIDQAASALSWRNILSGDLISNLAYQTEETGKELGEALAQGLAEGFDESTATKQQILDEISNLKKIARKMDAGADQTATYQRIEQLQGVIKSRFGSKGNSTNADKKFSGAGVSMPDGMKMVQSWNDEGNAIYIPVYPDYSAFEDDIDIELIPDSVIEDFNAKAREKLQKSIDEIHKSWNDLQADMRSDAIRELTGAFSALGNAIGGVAGSMVSLVASMAEQIAQGVATIASLKAQEEEHRANMTAALGDAAAQAMSAHSSIPFVGVAIGAGMVASIIATLMSLPKFANGGIVGGNNHNDGILARVSSGEMILNEEQQSNLMQMINRGVSGSGARGELKVRIENDELVGTLGNASNRSKYIID